MERRGRRRVWFWLAAGIGVAACKSAPPADPQRVAVEEKRLLRPYLENAPAQIGCEELTVTMTANFASLTDRTITNLPYDASGNLVNPNGFGAITGVAPPRTLQLVTRVTF